MILINIEKRSTFDVKYCKTPGFFHTTTANILIPSTEVGAKLWIHYLDKMPFFPCPSVWKLDIAILIMFFFLSAEGVQLICQFVMKMSKY